MAMQQVTALDVINMSHDFPDMIQFLSDQGQVQSLEKMQGWCTNKMM